MDPVTGRVTPVSVRKTGPATERRLIDNLNRQVHGRAAIAALLILFFLLSFILIPVRMAFSGEKDSILEESGISYPGGFDPNTVGVVQGKASQVTRSEKGPVSFQLTSGRETYTVMASPAWHWNDSQLKVSDGTEVAVRGSKSYGKDGKLYIVAQEIRLVSTGQSVSFREKDGTPLWTGSERSGWGSSGGFGSSPGGRGGMGGGFGGGGRGRR